MHTCQCRPWNPSQGRPCPPETCNRKPREDGFMKTTIRVHLATAPLLTVCLSHDKKFKNRSSPHLRCNLSHTYTYVTQKVAPRKLKERHNQPLCHLPSQQRCSSTLRLLLSSRSQYPTRPTIFPLPAGYLLFRPSTETHVDEGVVMLTGGC